MFTGGTHSNRTVYRAVSTVLLPHTAHNDPVPGFGLGAGGRPSPLVASGIWTSPFVSLWNVELGSAEISESDLPAVGHIVDGWVFTDQAGTLTAWANIWTLAGGGTRRQLQQWPIVASTTLLIQGWRIPGAAVQFEIVNTAASDQTVLEFDLLIRSA